MFYSLHGVIENEYFFLFNPATTEVLNTLESLNLA